MGRRNLSNLIQTSGDLFCRTFSHVQIGMKYIANAFIWHSVSQIIVLAQIDGLLKPCDELWRYLREGFQSVFIFNGIFTSCNTNFHGYIRRTLFARGLSLCKEVSINYVMCF